MLWKWGNMQFTSLTQGDGHPWSWQSLLVKTSVGFVTRMVGESSMQIHACKNYS